MSASASAAYFAASGEMLGLGGVNADCWDPDTGADAGGTSAA